MYICQGIIFNSIRIERKVPLKKIGINWIKLSLAVTIAIELAMLLNLEFEISAGIVAILTIQPTKKETISTALGRLVAFVIALIIAFICFSILGITKSAFLIYIMIYIFVCYLFNWNNAITMNSVLVSHFVMLERMDVSQVVNEVLIFAIGVGIGIIANLHLHKKVDYIEKMKKEADRQIIWILRRMSERILNKDLPNYNSECFKVLEKQLRDAKNLAEENYNNQFRKNDIYDIEYLSMCERQYIVLYEMYRNVSKLGSKPITAEKVANFFAYMADEFDKNNDGKELMKQFREMDMYMKSQPLPVIRQEFEDRARLFNLMRKIEEFICIKMEFYQNLN